MADFKILTGDERDRQVDHDGCCLGCGFMERGILAVRDEAGKAGVVCDECFVQRGREPDTRAVYLPEMPSHAFSHYLRALSWMTFAARADMVRGHDFTADPLPDAFKQANGWKAPMKWNSLAEGLADDGADLVSQAGLRTARQAFAFVASRLARTEALHGTNDATRVRNSVGIAVFERDYRAMRPGIEMSRIREWGDAGSTFRLVGRRNKQK